MGKTDTENHEMLKQVHGDDTIYRSCNFECFNLFKDDRIGVAYDSHTRR